MKLTDKITIEDQIDLLGRGFDVSNSERFELGYTAQVLSAIYAGADHLAVMMDASIKVFDGIQTVKLSGDLEISKSQQVKKGLGSYSTMRIKPLGKSDSSIDLVTFDQGILHPMNFLQWGELVSEEERNQQTNIFLLLGYNIEETLESFGYNRTMLTQPQYGMFKEIQVTSESNFVADRIFDEQTIHKIWSKILDDQGLVKSTVMANDDFIASGVFSIGNEMVSGASYGLNLDTILYRLREKGIVKDENVQPIHWQRNKTDHQMDLQTGSLVTNENYSNGNVTYVMIGSLPEEIPLQVVSEAASKNQIPLKIIGSSAGNISEFTVYTNDPRQMREFLDNFMITSHDYGL